MSRQPCKVLQTYSRRHRNRTVHLTVPDKLPWGTEESPCSVFSTSSVSMSSSVGSSYTENDHKKPARRGRQRDKENIPLGKQVHGQSTSDANTKNSSTGSDEIFVSRQQRPKKTRGSRTALRDRTHQNYNENYLVDGGKKKPHWLRPLSKAKLNENRDTVKSRKEKISMANFSEIEEYSLIIAESPVVEATMAVLKPVKQTSTEWLSIETSTPCQQQTVSSESKKQNFTALADKSYHSDLCISRIESLSNSPAEEQNRYSSHDSDNHNIQSCLINMSLGLDRMVNANSGAAGHKYKFDPSIDRTDAQSCHMKTYPRFTNTETSTPYLVGNSDNKSNSAHCLHSLRNRTVFQGTSYNTHASPLLCQNVHAHTSIHQAENTKSNLYDNHDSGRGGFTPSQYHIYNNCHVQVELMSPCLLPCSSLSNGSSESYSGSSIGASPQLNVNEAAGHISELYNSACLFSSAESEQSSYSISSKAAKRRTRLTCDHILDRDKHVLGRSVAPMPKFLIEEQDDTSNSNCEESNKTDYDNEDDDDDDYEEEEEDSLYNDCDDDDLSSISEEDEDLANIGSQGRTVPESDEQLELCVNVSLLSLASETTHQSCHSPDQVAGKSRSCIEVSDVMTYCSLEHSDDVSSITSSYHTAPPGGEPSFTRQYTHSFMFSRHGTSIEAPSFSDMMSPGIGKCNSSSRRQKASIAELSAREKILIQCSQEEPCSFSQCLPRRKLNNCVKIGEGVYGEVFSTKNASQPVAIKIIPIEGDFEVNDEKQKTYEEILPEIVISRELSALRCSSSTNFIHVNSVQLVKGSYPEHLLNQWNQFHKARTSMNDRPDIFDEEQLFIVFEFANGGSDLEAFKFENIFEAFGMLQQVAYSLAIAECAMEFEHRDLHWGNVLIKRTTAPTISYCLEGKNIDINSQGIEVSIIDFTLSRLRKDNCVVFCDLSQDATLFEGGGDYQFDIYRKMQEENGNQWEGFNPHSNVLWLHYLADKMVHCTEFINSTRSDRDLMREFRTFLKEGLQYGSALHLITESEFINRN